MSKGGGIDIEDIAIVSKTGYEVVDGVSLPVVQLAPIDDGSAMPSNPHHPLGLIAMPKGRDVDPQGRTLNGCKALKLGEGHQTHCILLDDVRAFALLPRVDDGGFCLYAPGNPDSNVTADASGNINIRVPTGKTVTIDVGTIQIVASATGVQIKGIMPAAPMLVGDKAAKLPANAVLCGASASPGQVPSTVLFAAIV